MKEDSKKSSQDSKTSGYNTDTVQDKHSIECSVESIETFLDIIWPIQGGNIDIKLALLELFIDCLSWIKVVHGSLVGAGRDVKGGLLGGGIG